MIIVYELLTLTSINRVILDFKARLHKIDGEKYICRALGEKKVSNEKFGFLFAIKAVKLET